MSLILGVVNTCEEGACDVEDAIVDQIEAAILNVGVFANRNVKDPTLPYVVITVQDAGIGSRYGVFTTVVRVRVWADTKAEALDLARAVSSTVHMQGGCTIAEEYCIHAKGLPQVAKVDGVYVAQMNLPIVIRVAA